MRVETIRDGAPMKFTGKLAAGMLAILSIFYLAQAASPLRLNTDSVVFLSMAASASDGHGFMYQEKPTHFPPGYPAIVAAMDRLGIASSSSLVLLNCLFIATGLLAIWGMMRRITGFERDLALLVCALTLLSFVLIKHMSVPLTDVPFFGVATPGLYFAMLAERETGGRKWRLVLLAGILAVCAIFIRSIGVALLPALAWACIPGSWVQWAISTAARNKRRSVIIGVAVLAGIAIPTAVILARTAYIREALDVYANGHGLQMIFNILGCRLQEWGELMMNLPASKMPSFIGAILPLAGLFALCVVAFAMWRRRAFGVLEIYLLGYGAILFVWPYKDTRFWLPVVGLFAMLIANALRHFGAALLPRIAVTVYLVLFSCMGFASLAYSTRLTFSGDRFPELYGDAQTRAIYRKAIGETADENLVIPEWLSVLGRYEPGMSRHAR